MEVIEGIVFEPVGCLADFPAAPFLELAFQLFGRKKKASQSGSRAYWHLLNLIQSGNKSLEESERKLIEACELEAVAAADVYQDVVPALTELKAMGIQLFIASSLSEAATKSFLDKHSLNEFFSGVWTSDNSKGLKAAPLEAAVGNF